MGRFDIINPDTGTADTAYTDTDVTPSTRYVYRVKAINPAGTSRQSRYLRAQTPSSPPSNDDEGGDGSDDGGVIADSSIPLIDNTDKLSDGELDYVRNIITVIEDPPPLQFAPQTTAPSTTPVMGIWCCLR